MLVLDRSPNVFISAYAKVIGTEPITNEGGTLDFVFFMPQQRRSDHSRPARLAVLGWTSERSVFWSKRAGVHADHFVPPQLAEVWLSILCPVGCLEVFAEQLQVFCHRQCKWKEPLWWEVWVQIICLSWWTLVWWLRSEKLRCLPQLRQLRSQRLFLKTPPQSVRSLMCWKLFGSWNLKSPIWRPIFLGLRCLSQLKNVQGFCQNCGSTCMPQRVLPCLWPHPCCTLAFQVAPVCTLTFCLLLLPTRCLSGVSTFFQVVFTHASSIVEKHRFGLGDDLSINAGFASFRIVQPAVLKWCGPVQRSTVSLQYSKEKPARSPWCPTGVPGVQLKGFHSQASSLMSFVA